MNTLLYTDGYANGPIEYESDSRFIPLSVTKTVDEASDVERDTSSFLSVNGRDLRTQIHMISIETPVWDKSKFSEVIGPERVNFTFFV